MRMIDAPTSLKRSDLTALIRGLGINPDDAVELHITPDRVELVVNAVNERGRHFCHPSGELAQHTIALDIVED